MKFLVPTDFSDYARDALIYAIEMGRVFGGSITLVNVFPPASISPYVYDELIKSVTGEIKTRTINKLKNEWSKESKRIQKSDKQITTDFKALEGGIVDNIVTTAQKSRADLIVMGTKGGGNITRFLFGTTATKVIDNAPCPVLAIPELAKYKKIRRILFASSCNKHEVESIIDAIELARAYGARIDIIYVSDDSKEKTQSDLERMIKLVGSKTDYKKIHFEAIYGDDVVEAIDVYTQLKNVSLLALASRKRSLFKRLFDRSLAEEMSFHSKIPLLVYHR